MYIYIYSVCRILCVSHAMLNLQKPVFFPKLSAFSKGPTVKPALVEEAWAMQLQYYQQAQQAQAQQAQQALQAWTMGYIIGISLDVGKTVS